MIRRSDSFKVFLLASSLSLFTPSIWAQSNIKEIEKRFDRFQRSEGIDSVKDFEKACQDLAAAGKKGVEVLLERGLSLNDPDRRAPVEAALATLKDRSDQGLVIKELGKSKSIPARLSLCQIVKAYNDKPSLQALEKALKEKESAVVEAAAKAIAGHGMGKESIPELKRALQVGSLRVKKAAAEALSQLGETVAGYETVWRDDGFPEKLHANHVVILFDTTPAMHEARFEPMPAPADPKERKKAMPLDYALSAVNRALDGIPEDCEFELAAFTLSSKSFEKKPIKANSRGLKDARAWLTKRSFSSLDDRDVARAVSGFAADSVDEIYLLLCDGPSGMKSSEWNSVVAKIVDALNPKGIKLHTILLELPKPGTAETSEEQTRRKAASNARKDFATLLASKTGGHCHVVNFSEFKDEKSAVPGSDPGSKPESKPGTKPESKPGDSGSASSGASGSGSGGSKGYEPPAVEKGRLSSRDTSKVLKDIKTAAASPKNDWSREVASKAAALPSEKIAAAILSEVVLSKDMGFSEAGIRGLAANAEAAVIAEIAKSLRSEKDEGHQVLFVRCFNKSAAAITEELGALVPKLGNDAQRLALELLAQRPREETAKLSRDLARKMKDLTGYRAYYQKVIEGKLALEPVAIGPGSYLPVRSAADGVLFIVDVTRDSQLELKKALKDKDGKDLDPKKKENRAVTRINAMAQEVQRLLAGLGANKQRALVQELGDNPPGRFGLMHPHSAKEAEEAAAWLEKRADKPVRDVAASLLKALNNPEVEEIYVMACGLAERALPKDTEEILNLIEATNRKRGVKIHVTLVYGLADEATLDDIKKARRSDDLSRLKELWQSLADRNGGQFSLRLTLPVEAAPAPAPAPAPKPTPAPEAPK